MHHSHRIVISLGVAGFCLPVLAIGTSFPVPDAIVTSRTMGAGGAASWFGLNDFVVALTISPIAGLKH